MPLNSSPARSTNRTATARRALNTMPETAFEAHSSIVGSRPTSSLFGGKGTVDLKTSLPEKAAADWHRFWVERGYGSSADAQRELMLKAMYGSDYLISLHAERIKSLDANRPGIVPGQEPTQQGERA